MREIVVDTETTGLDFSKEKIIEIGCVELFDKIPTGKFLQIYINPQKIIDDESIRIHGLTNEFLKDKPNFATISKEFLDFLEFSPIIAHNAVFDMSFINFELRQIGLPALTNKVIDTLVLFKKLYPNEHASLNAICRKFRISTSHRTIHGAYKDALLLADAYYILATADTPLLWSFISETTQESVLVKSMEFPHRPMAQLTEQELTDHSMLLKKIKAPQW